MLMPQAPIGPLLSCMLLPMKVEVRSKLLQGVLGRLSVPNGYIRDAVRYKRREDPPRMYRIIEGDPSTALLRMPPPYLQKLDFGRTRTRLATAVTGATG